jgi:O-antigen/teichoic acid export membrane protein
MLASTLMLLVGWVDTIMLGAIKSEYEVGIYSVALKLAAILGIPLMAMNGVMATKLAQYWKNGDHSATKSLVYRSSQIIFFCSVPIAILIVIFSEKILFLFGNEFGSGNLALMILVAGQLISALCVSVGNFLQMTGAEKVFQRIVMLSLVINAAFNYLLIPTYGMTGAAIASSISIASWNILAAAYIWKRHKIIMVARW